MNNADKNSGDFQRGFFMLDDGAGIADNCITSTRRQTVICV